MKICYTCHKEKDEQEFATKKKKPSNLCKECNREKSRLYHQKNKLKCNEKRKKLYHDNREEYLEKQKKRYWENHAELRRKYNARNKTPEERAKARIRSLNWIKNNRERHNENQLRNKKKHPKRSMAHQYVMWALRLNVLKKPEFCQKCNCSERLDAHHTDYDKPLEVIWLCRLCHMHIHNKLLDINPKVEDGNANRSTS